MRTAVITIAHGRHDHLAAQEAALAASRRPADLRVVVAMADPAIDAPVRVPLVDGSLPLAAARNAGAAAALERGAELLVFLDVDCLPAPRLLERYEEAAASVDGLLCGPVAYLPPRPPGGYPLAALRELGDPHPARPVPGEQELRPAPDTDLFWSLSFAVTASTWLRTGGFCEDYRGYGGEDTDFGRAAARAGVAMWWVGGAWAFHQHHGPGGPPVQHLEDVLRNGAVFHRRWGSWPMQGWLEDFQARGLVRREGDGWVRCP